METEIIDKLFLELSQVTKAATKKELELKKLIERYKNAIKDQPVSVEDAFRAGYAACATTRISEFSGECLLRWKGFGRMVDFAYNEWSTENNNKPMPPAPKE